MTAEFGDPEAVKRAIEAIQSTLNVFPAPQLQAEVEAGLHPNLLRRQSVLVRGSPVRVIERYLIGATTFLRQPVNHYDVFAAARSVLMTQLLGEALEIIDAAKISTAEDRLKRLIPVFDSDAYESTLFELVAGTRYAVEPTVTQVEFIPEQNVKTPDFLVKRGNLESLVECEKVARVRQVNAATRAVIRERLNFVISHFRKIGISLLFEFVFTSDPGGISKNELLHACRAAFEDKALNNTGTTSNTCAACSRKLRRPRRPGGRDLLFRGRRFRSRRRFFCPTVKSG